MDDADARIGTRLGNYALGEIIGRGGMGVVYRAEHVYIHKPAAVKVLHQQFFGNREARQRFLREAQAASGINHPHIVGVTDFGEEPDGTIFLVMEHVAGRPLDRVLRQEKTIDLFRTIVILGQVSRALAEAHRKGVVHRDLKPENIMLDRRAERREIVTQVPDAHGTLEVFSELPDYDFAVVLDFGAAKVWDGQRGRSSVDAGLVMATPAYMAPETARIGVSDTRSDIYALGVIFYQMLTGTLPFVGDTPAEVMMKHVLDEPEPASVRNPHVEITPEAERLLQKALAKDPEMRPRSMDDFNTELQRCYGRVRFRRSSHTGEVLSFTQLRKPIPLTREKRPSSSGMPAVASPVPKPPVPLVKRKGHRTLPFGVNTPTPTPIPSRSPTSPYLQATPAPEGIKANHAASDPHPPPPLGPGDAKAP